ncbi:MAG: sigma-54 dependent transcriptional regulator [Candidatus Adiutrix sp.]|jgi:two-component system nitrogen regulation response regulator NtrX|nr:sigma-54 dependent transcriptional regulator [Candidatus Adiutrix sp.]
MTDTILVVDDERDIRLTIGGLLGDEGYLVAQASSGSEALERIDESAPELVILDLWMQNAEQGFDVLTRIREEYPHLPVVVISGHGNIETAVRAVKLGAFDYIEKPLSADKLLLTVERALSFRRLSAENQILKTRSKSASVMIGQSRPLAELMRKIEAVAPTPASVLITGENGVGKELAARTVHLLSQRADRPMIEVNCAAIPEELVESELFGHEKGAFTGAAARKQGRFDQANHSTLFLDEIGDMSLKTQAKVLRILQEQKFERVGGVKTISVDVRVIAASNKDLEKEIERGAFRQDLFYRLNVVPLRVPALRERPEDIPLLADEFLSAYARDNNLGSKRISRAMMDDLRQRPWPGNVRELKNTIERLAIMTPGELIDVDPAASGRPLPPRGATRGPAENDDYMSLPYRKARAEFERIYLLRQLSAHDHNITQTAEAIDMDRTSLHKKLKALDFKDWAEGK